MPLRGITSEIRVRLFPILSAPAGEPYPITKNVNDLKMRNSAGLNIFDEGTLVGESKSIQISFSSKKLRLSSGMFGSDREIPLKTYQFVPKLNEKVTSIVWDDEGESVKVSLDFRGYFSVTPTYFTEQREYLWSLLNHVDIEDYLASVVPSEVPTSWHSVALSVQAIAARSYAVRQMVIARDAQRPWDVDPTTMFQSYRGANKESEVTTQAVRDTKGKILTFEGGVIEASFSSHSGGITCSAVECFERSEEAPYLQSVTDAIELETREVPPVGTWEACTTPELIQYQLAKYKFGGSERPDFDVPAKRTPLEVCQDEGFRQKVQAKLDTRLKMKLFQLGLVSATERVWDIRLDLQSGDQIKLKRSETKDNQQTPYLPSMRSVFMGRRSHLMKLVEVDAEGVYRFQGHGFGHGVGLSQYGVQWRAQKYKQTIEQILSFYYRATEIIRLDLDPLSFPHGEENFAFGSVSASADDVGDPDVDPQF